MENEKDYGLIYGLTNPYFKGMVKIGATRNLDINKRMRVLGTAVPEPFVCAFAYKVPLDMLFTVEHTLHDTFDNCRMKGSEFFKIDPCKVDNLLHMLGKFEPMTTTVQETINIVTAEEVVKVAKRKAPNMDFVKMGLEIGSSLVYMKDHAISCKVISNKKVAYNGEAMSLSALTHQLLGTKYAVQPSPYWETEYGKPLTTLYIEYVQKQNAKAHEQFAKNAKSAADGIAQCDELINAKV